MLQSTYEILAQNNPNVFASTLPRFGSGQGMFMDRSKPKKSMREILIKRQHGVCAIYGCGKTVSNKKVKFECSHIVPHSAAAPLELSSDVFPEAVYPNAFISCQQHNKRMSNHVLMWVVEAAAYYGWGEVDHAQYEAARESFQKFWQPDGDIFWPFWLVSEREQPIFLVDGFDEQEYFKKMIESYREWEENEDGGIIKSEMARDTLW